MTGEELIERRVCLNCGQEKKLTAFKKRGNNIGNICRKCTYSKSTIPDIDYSKEQWREVVGCEGLYDVSNCGRVKSRDRQVKTVFNARRVIKGKILNPDYAEYARVGLSLRDGVKKRVFVHVLVAKAFLKKPEGKEQVNHIDHNKYNNALSNLEWTTQSDNMIDAKNSGMIWRGSQLTFSKLDEESVIEIRSLLESGNHPKKVAEMFNISETNIRDIKKRKIWNHV